MRAVSVAVLVAVLALVSRSCAKYHVFDFQNGLESAWTNRGLWTWASKETIRFPLQSGTRHDGFAVMERLGRRDVLHLPAIEYTGKARFSMRFFMSSRSENSTMSVRMYEKTRSLRLLLDLKPYVRPDRDEWVIVSSQLPNATHPVQLSIICFNAKPLVPENLPSGCVVEKVVVHEEDTPTTATTTINPMHSTTITPGHFNEAATTPIHSTTITPGHFSRATTTPMHSMTLTPGHFSEAATMHTTEPPKVAVVFSFEREKQGWTTDETLHGSWSLMNYGYGPRSTKLLTFSCFARRFYNDNRSWYPPPHNGAIPKISGCTGVAQSPLLVARTTELFMEVVALGKTKRDISPRLTVTVKGQSHKIEYNMPVNIVSDKWTTYSAQVTVPHGEVVIVSLEGTKWNSSDTLQVKSIGVAGVELLPNQPSMSFDFETGFFGWQHGQTEGGRWTLKDWSTTEPVPQPSQGKRFLRTERFQRVTGMLSLHSPIYPAPKVYQVMSIQFNLFVKGSFLDPVYFRLSWRNPNSNTLTPLYTVVGEADRREEWRVIEEELSGEDDVQFVFDGFIGSNKTNVIAIDDFKISMKNVGLENLHAAWSQYQLLKNTSNGAFQTYNNEEDDEDRQSPEELIRRLEDIV